MDANSASTLVGPDYAENVVPVVAENAAGRR